VVEFQVWVVAAGKEDFRLVCANRLNVVLIIIYLVLLCFAVVGVAAAAVVAVAVVAAAVAVVAAAVAVADDESRVKSEGVVPGECWHTVWLIRRHLLTIITFDTSNTRTLLRKIIAWKSRNIHLHDAV
jgi:hypothetical protein